MKPSNGRTGPKPMVNPTTDDSPWRSSRDVMLTQRKLILKKFHYTKQPGLKALAHTMKKLLRCKEGLTATGLRPKPFDCNKAICPHCHNRKRNSNARAYAAKFDAFTADEIFELVLKIPAITPDFVYSDNNALRSSLTNIRKCFSLFRATVEHELPSIIKGGVYGIHTRYVEETDEHAHHWDIHIHAVVAGRVSPVNVDKMASIWKRISKRDDGKAFRIKPTQRLVRSCGYLIPSIASTFSYKKSARSKHDRSSASLDRAIHALEIVDMWLDSLSPIPGTSKVSANRTLGTWGVCRKKPISNSLSNKV